MSAVPGLNGALKLYESDKIKDRAQGSSLLREIIGNRSNLELLQATANRDGWVALFQCLFAAVITEKKTVVKKFAANTESGLTAGESLFCPPLYTFLVLRDLLALLAFPSLDGFVAFYGFVAFLAFLAFHGLVAFHGFVALHGLVAFHGFVAFLAFLAFQGFIAFHALLAFHGLVAFYGFVALHGFVAFHGFVALHDFLAVH
jgi:ataxia telangiectasia mutated family protein